MVGSFLQEPNSLHGISSGLAETKRKIEEDAQNSQITIDRDGTDQSPITGSLTALLAAVLFVALYEPRVEYFKRSGSEKSRQGFHAPHVAYVGARLVFVFVGTPRSKRPVGESCKGR